MPKRPKTQNNTLFNYFQSPKSTLASSNLNKQKENTEPESDPEELINVKRKRNCSIITSDSDTENTETPTSSKKTIKKSKVISNDSENESDQSLEEVKKAGNAKRKRVLEFDNNSADKRKSLKDFSFSSERTPVKSIDEKEIDAKNKTSISNNVGVEDNWEHHQMRFLQPKHIMDANRKSPNHPDYEKSTLYVPDDFLCKQTPAMHQWWILKSKHFDTVLFFKVGKFYELYHMDAVIGVNHLGLSFMKGSFAHSGFPEIAYGRMASSLVEQGFKVARIEQTETPEMMAERCKSTKKPTKFDKVVKREICQITTKATCVYGAQLQAAKRSLPCYMIAIAETALTSGSRFGVCFIDTSIGIFNLSEFDDDKYYSRLLSLLAQHPPELILVERGRMKTETSDLLKKTFSNISRDALCPKTQFFDAQGTINFLMKGCYFLNKEEDFEWPPVLIDLVDNNNPKAGYELVLKSLGACIWYLKDSEIDIQVLSLKKFSMYNPIDTAATNGVSTNFMILDSMTLGHLDLLGGEGSLQTTIDFCVTPFGKRLLQQWICRPLSIQENIELRLEAVKELVANDHMRECARSILKTLPDLERLVIKIHGFGNRFIAKQHPDSRAIFYEASTYSANKIRDLVNTLRGFNASTDLLLIFTDCESRILKGLTTHPPNGQFYDLGPTLEYFKNAFDQHEAETKSKLISKEGVDDEYDKSLEAISELEAEIEKYRRQQDKIFHCKVAYHGTAKNRFQIEVPEKKCHHVTEEYKLEGSKKGSNPVRRYSTPVTIQFVVDMIKAEAKRDRILQDLNRRIFEKFSNRSEEWEQVIQCLTMLDVLCSFAEYAKTSTHAICFPKVLPFSSEPYIKIENGVHPCTKLEDFVPNNTNIGNDNNSKIMLLTGPNMGGKSTLMRQTALITIMAQMGCPVPATSCELTLVDRIFTRIGAQDDILQRSSTFMVELSEAAAILRHATKHSFVLIDELGRGTSTHDGNAIASAYVNKLISIQCRTIFSTHYHSLVERFAKEDDVQLAHMACLSNDQEDLDKPKVSVTLLYQLQNGNCPESYGFNAARLAGLSKEIVQNAHKVARHFEKVALQRSYFCSLLSGKDHDVLSIIKNISELRF